MADEQMKPADMVAAGGTAPPADQAGIMDALRSRGPVPQSALANLQQPPPGLMGMGLTLPPAPMPANLGIAAGSGMLAGLAGRQGNPYLSQHAEEQERARQYQQDMLRMQERQQAQRERQNEVAITVSKELLESDSPEAQRAGASNISALYKSIYGIDTKPEYWTKRNELKAGERDDIDSMLLAGVDRAAIVARYPKLSGMPGWLETEANVLKNPTVRRKITGMTEDEERAKVNETRTTLAHQEAVRVANERLLAGKATPGDYLILGAKNAKEVGERVFAEYVGTGRPIPPELQPYYKIGEQELSPKITNEFQAYMAKHPGDPAAAIAEMNKDRKERLKPTASEYEMMLRIRQQGYFDKVRSGQQLSPAEKRDASAIDGFLRGDESASKAPKAADFKRVTISKDARPGYQSAVDEVAKQLTASGRLPNDGGRLAPDGRPKERVIEEAYAREHPNQRVHLQWKASPVSPTNPYGGRFEIVELKERPEREGTQEAETPAVPQGRAPAQGQGAPQQQAPKPPLLGAARPPAKQTKEAAVAEVQRLMGKGLSKADAIAAMKKAGWDVKG